MFVQNTRWPTGHGTHSAWNYDRERERGIEMKKLFISIAMVSMLAIAASAQAGKIGVRQWKLIQLNGVNIADSSTAYVELNSDQTRLIGNAG